LGCTFNANNKTSDFPIKPAVVCPDKDDCLGGDVRLSIINSSENDTSRIYKIISKYQNSDVGLLIVISKATTDNKGFGKYIILKSIGNSSDGFLKMLEVLYHQRVNSNSKFVASIPASYVNLKEFARSVADKSSDSDDIDEYKLFFENKQDEGELFLNVNDKDHWVEFREKDQEYRPVIISMFSKN
jgi:hypothetical protein